MQKLTYEESTERGKGCTKEKRLTLTALNKHACRKSHVVTFTESVTQLFPFFLYTYFTGSILHRHKYCPFLIANLLYNFLCSSVRQV